MRNFSYFCNLKGNRFMNDRLFRLVLMDEAASFLRALPVKARDKIAYNIRRIEKGEKDNELFKKLEGSEIWEFRTIYFRTAYRLFAFWDTEKETLVIATHGIVKKSQKILSKEIEKAEKIRIEYFKNKQLWKK